MSDHSDYTLKVTEEGIVEILSTFTSLRKSILEDVTSLLKSSNDDRSDEVSLFFRNDLPEDISSENNIPGGDAPVNETDNLSDLFEATEASASKTSEKNYKR